MLIVLFVSEKYYVRSELKIPSVRKVKVKIVTQRQKIVTQRQKRKAILQLFCLLTTSINAIANPNLPLTPTLLQMFHR